MSFNLLFKTGQQAAFRGIYILAISAQLGHTVLPEGFQQFLRDGG
jgi:hypothetical protein